MKSFWMRLWNCGPIQYPLLMKNSIIWYKTRAVSVGYPDRDCSVFGSRCLEWSLDSSCPGHHSVLRQTGSCPEFPVWGVLHDLPPTEHEILWVFGSSEAALLLHIHSKDIAGSPEESGSWVLLSHLFPSFPSLHFPSLCLLSPLRKKSQNPIKVAFFFPLSHWPISVLYREAEIQSPLKKRSSFSIQTGSDWLQVFQERASTQGTCKIVY